MRQPKNEQHWQVNPVLDRMLTLGGLAVGIALGVAVAGNLAKVFLEADQQTLKPEAISAVTPVPQPNSGAPPLPVKRAEELTIPQQSSPSPITTQPLKVLGYTATELTQKIRAFAVAHDHAYDCRSVVEAKQIIQNSGGYSTWHVACSTAKPPTPGPKYTVTFKRNREILAVFDGWLLQPK